MIEFTSIFLAVAVGLLIVISVLVGASYLAIWAVDKLSGATVAVIIFLGIVAIFSTAIYHSKY